VLSKQLLKDYPFYATRIGGFLDNFQDAFKINTDDKDKIKNVIIKSFKGGLSRIPNLTKLKNIIDKGFDFMYSHEILFNNDIPLDKYCIAVIANSNVDDKESLVLEKLCGELNIPYHRMEKLERKYKFKSYGLNKFVEIIDKLINK
jgi:hypothetical protein